MLVNRIVCVLSFVYAVKGDYVVPSLTLEALYIGGFRVYIPDEPGTALFAFHANINDNIRVLHRGTINGEARAPTNGFWILEFNDKLKPGDKVNYWAFIHANNRGHRKEGDSLTVTRLLDDYTLSFEVPTCETASTVITGGKSTCLH